MKRSGLATLLLVLTGAAALAPPSYAAGTACNGVAATIKGTIEADTIIGTSGNDVIAADAGADVIDGRGGNDLICGEVGNDTILGGSGNDRMLWAPGDGNDQVDGGTGTDRVDFTTSAAAEAIDVEQSLGKLVIRRNIANIRFETAGVERLFLSVLGGADDVELGDLKGSGVTELTLDLASTLNGPTGDTLADTVTWNGSPFADTAVLTSTTTRTTLTARGISYAVRLAENGTDKLRYDGQTGRDSVTARGTSATDVLTAFPVAADAQVNFGIGTNPVLLVGAERLTLDGQGGNDQISCQPDLDSVVESVLLGGPGNDSLSGSSGDDSLSGGDGNDTLHGGLGTDSISGGTGSDTFSWQPALGSDSLSGGPGSDKVNLLGSANPDAFVVSNVEARAVVEFDADPLVESPILQVRTTGIEAMDFGLGAGADTVSFANLAGTGVLTSKVLPVADGQADTVSVTGTSGPDRITLTGNPNAVTVSGVVPRVTMLTNDFAQDVVMVDGRAGSDTVTARGTSEADVMGIKPSVNGELGIQLASNTALFGIPGIETVNLLGLAGDDLMTVSDAVEKVKNTLDGGTGHDTITGNEIANTLIGGSGNDTLDGLSGNDLLDGGTGNDTLIGNLGQDTVTYAAATAGVTVNLGAGIATGLGSDTISGVEHVTGGRFSDRLTGNSVANRLVGGSGNDRLTAGGGKDTLSGQAGNDRLDGGSATDTCSGGSGTDTATRCEKRSSIP